MSFCRLDQPNVFVVTVKRAEDGLGTIVRLIETDGKETTATLTLASLAIEKAWQTNLVEENQTELNCTGNSVVMPVRAFGISTLRAGSLTIPRRLFAAAACPSGSDGRGTGPGHAGDGCF